MRYVWIVFAAIAAWLLFKGRLPGAQRPAPAPGQPPITSAAERAAADVISGAGRAAADFLFGFAARGGDTPYQSTVPLGPPEAGADTAAYTF